MPRLVGKSPHQYLPEPGRQLGLGLTEELTKLAMRFQECFLHEVGRIEPHAQGLANHGGTTTRR